jgi:hypothetical protein
MNEKIKQLAINSQLVSKYKGELISGWQEGVDLTEYLEKFAELIVLECAVIVGSMEEPHQDIAKLIKQHFGVKE